MRDDPRPPHERGTNGEVFIFFLLPFFVLIGIPLICVLEWIGKAIK